MISAPFWPAYGEAFEKKDREWIKKTFKRSLLLMVPLPVFLSALLVILGPWLIRAWVGSSILPPRMLLFAPGLSGILSAGGVPLAMLLHAANVIRFQVIAAGTACRANIGISIVLTKKIGISGVVFGSIISQSVLILVPYLLYVRKFLRALPADTAHCPESLPAQGTL